MVIGFNPSEDEKFLSEVFTSRGGRNFKRLIKKVKLPEDITITYHYTSDDLIEKINKSHPVAVILLGTKTVEQIIGHIPLNGKPLNKLNTTVYCWVSEKKIFMMGKDFEEKTLKFLNLVKEYISL